MGNRSFIAMALVAVISLCAAAQNDISRIAMAFDGPKVKIAGLERHVLEPRDNANRVWRNVSPGFINVPFSVKVKGETITILVDIGILIQSVDGGKSWRHLTFNSQGGISCPDFFDFDINPADDKNIVIGGLQLFRSPDGGASWHAVANGLPKTMFGTRSGAFGQVRFNADGSCLLTAIGTSRITPTYYEKLISSHYARKSLFLSKNGGASFSTLDLGTPFAPIRRIFADPANANRFLVSFADGELYVCENIKAQKPEFAKVKLPDGYFALDICAIPDKPNEFIASLAPIASGKGESSLVHLSASLPAGFKCESVPLKDVEGKDLHEKGLFLGVGFNPNQRGQFVVGVSGTDYLLISDDNLKSFHRQHLPKELYCDDRLGHFYGQVENVTFGNSPHAVANSRIGTWISEDGFKTMRDLTMSYSRGLFGNNGVGMPANVDSLAITKDHALFSGVDHGAWRSNGKDYSKWSYLTGQDSLPKFPTQPAPWGRYTWLFQTQRLFASYDENFLYIQCGAMISRQGHYKKDKKLFLSRDLGDTWADVTARLGRGDVYPGGSVFLKILFDKGDSRRQWLLFSDAVYFTSDGAKSFTKLESPLFSGIGEKQRIRFSDIAFDPVHDILYLGVCPDRLGLPAGHAAVPPLYRSFDKGRSWEVYDIAQNSVRSLGVTASGTLIVGTQLTGTQPARLIAIPFGSKFDNSMIKLTVGDVKEEREANQLSIWPVICDGEDVLAYSNIEWIHSDRFFAQGPLLSRDGGKSFEWILQDLPNTFIWSAEMRDGKILLGTTSGIMFWQYK